MIYDLNKLDKPLKEIIKLLKPFDIVYLKKNYIYNEKIIIDTKNITLIGNNTSISYDLCHSDIRNDKMVGTTGSASFLLTRNADNFMAKGISFINSHIRNISAKNQAVAFKSEANNIILLNCKFISNQDTLYLDYGTNNLIIDSYITGDVDFIFGSADAVFYNCLIEAKNYENLYFTAPDTYICNQYGLVFKKSKFISKKKAYLGRRWYPDKALMEVLPRLALVECEILGDINPSLIRMHDNDKDDHVLSFYNTFLNEKMISNTKDFEEILNYCKKLLDLQKNSIINLKKW